MMTTITVTGEVVRAVAEPLGLGSHWELLKKEMEKVC